MVPLSPQHKRGKNIAIYGLFFSLGFAVGPLLARMVQVNEALPFAVSSAITVVAWLAVLLIRNARPDDELETNQKGTFIRFLAVLKYAWVAMLPPLGYGFLEASLNGNFPVFALRNGMDIDAVSIILPAFSIGAILFQIPLGMLSDRYGRSHVLKAIMAAGALIFLISGLLQDSMAGLLICFTLAGMVVGSTFSLGISYMADLVPRDLLPAGNLMCGIFFSLGSMIGPFAGGIFIEYVSERGFFYLFSIMLGFIFAALFIFKEKSPMMEKQQAI